MSTIQIKPNNKDGYDAKLGGLDILRFLLSLVIIIYHYQHFYHPSHLKFEIYVIEEPFYGLLHPVYKYGALAVQIFWIISGIIFFKFYHNKIVAKKITFKTFMLNRFTRLYPLHLLTLVTVAFLQLYYYSIFKSTFVYVFNDLKYFLLNLLFVQNWFTLNGSFNGPSWSVSVEIFVYIAYFIICATGLMKNIGSNILIIFSFVILDNLGWGPIFFNQCFIYFFSGCLLIRAIDNDKIKVYKYLLSFGSYLIFHYILNHYFSENIAIKSILNISSFFPANLKMLLLFLSTIYIIIVIFDHKIFRNINTSLFQKLGNLTYGMYLIHFPIQICFYLILRPLNYKIFNSPFVFLSFILTTVILSFFIFNYFERPIQKKLRKLFFKNS